MTDEKYSAEDNNVLVIEEFPYSRISHELYNDPNLKMEDIGFFGLMVKKGNGWKFNREDMKKRSKLGGTRYNAMINRLKNGGYLEIKKIRNPKGHFVGSSWIINNSIIRGEREKLRDLSPKVTKPDGRLNGSMDYPTDAKPDDIEKIRIKKRLEDRKDYNNKDVVIKDNVVSMDLVREIFMDYNEVVKSESVNIPSAKSLTDKRIKSIRSVVKTLGLDETRKIVRIAAGSKFLQGKSAGVGANKKEWRASFDWLFNTNNAVKVTEGVYGGLDTLDRTPREKIEASKTKNMRMLDYYFETGLWPNAMLGPKLKVIEGIVQRSTFSKLSNDDYEYMQNQINIKKNVD